MNMAAYTPLAKESHRVGLDKELRIKSRLASIYTDVQGQYNTEKKQIPNAIYMSVDPKELSGSSSAVITMKMNLRQDGVYGNMQATGTEEGARTKSFRIFRNNRRKVVSKPGYGVDKLDADFLKLFEKHIDELAIWNMDDEDLHIHQGLIETFGASLTHEEAMGTNTVCQRNLNPNIFVAGLGAYDARQPVYNRNAAAYTTNVQNALTAAGGAKILTSNWLSNMSNYALKKRIERLDIPGLPGNKGYIVTISELQAMYLSDPEWCKNNLGNLWIQKTALSEKVMGWTGVIGSYKDLLIAVDMRAPTITFGGGVARVGYVEHGDSDKRDRTYNNPNACDVAVLHGKGALWKWEPEKLHSIKDNEDYGRIEGVGTARVWGIGIPIFWAGEEYGALDVGETAHEQFTSVVALCGMPGDVPAA